MPPSLSRADVERLVKEGRLPASALETVKKKPRQLDDLGRTKLEALFDTKWEQGNYGLPAPIPQHMALRPRLFRFDRSWPDIKVYVELEGGIFLASLGKGFKSGHLTPDGFESDCEKYNAASARGWFLFRLTDRMMRRDQAHIDLIAYTVKTRMAELGIQAESLRAAVQQRMEERNG